MKITGKQKKEIKDIIFKNFYFVEIETINDSSSLYADLDFDVLDLIDLMMRIESHFGITIPSSYWEDVETVENIYKIVNDWL